MNPCLSEHALERMLADLATPSQRAHLAVCSACAVRFRRLRHDLETIADVLVSTAEPGTESQPVLWRWRAGMAAVAALSVAALLWIELTMWTATRSIGDAGAEQEIALALDDLWPSFLSTDAEPGRSVEASAVAAVDPERDLITVCDDQVHPDEPGCTRGRTAADRAARVGCELRCCAEHRLRYARRMTMTRRQSRMAARGSVAAVVVLVATGVLSPAAQAQGPLGAGGWREGPARGLMLGVPLHSLNLTADQQSQIQSILSSYRTSARPIIQQLRQAQIALTDRLLAAGQVQAADLQSQLQQIGQLRNQLLQLSAQATLDIRNLLTPEQLTSAAQTKEKLRDLRSQMRQLLAPAGQR